MDRFSANSQNSFTTMSRRYTNFEQIDKDLQILRLNRDIAKENLKLTYSEARKSLYPTQLLGGFSGIIQKLIITVVAKKIVERFSR